ncbi:HAMP domain-containing sensor histidine kinase [Massilia sp. 9096]|uniref:sensor histidine kinase n=1 Tax=Massilia sp. 9096 TaxID=1500894 RepID=UPI001EFB3979|nr:HAMP domain-containing sensor histidine kinase [Massilia sp. 9096]
MHPILINTLPAYYDNIAEAITPTYPRLTAAAGTSIAAEHGGERARITEYDQQALISEYQIFRWVIFDVLYREGVQLEPLEVLIINESLDGAIKDAVQAFSLVGSALRERFAAALAHDLRNPLTAAMMVLDFIAVTDDPVEVKNMVRKAQKNLMRIDGMIHELLDTMSFHSGSSLSLQLSNFEVLDVVKEVQGEKIVKEGLHIQSGTTPVTGWWDRAALKRAIENIIGNAIKYRTSGTSITIKINEAHQRLLLTVHNVGQPIPPDEQEDIFQMYRRADATKRNEEGWGIGLPYVRAVAESHGGSIAVDSSVERGTTFCIDIPVDCRPLKDSPSVALPT